MKPANRKPGPRPRATSSAAQQSAIWGIIRGVRGVYTTVDISEELEIPLSTVQQYFVALRRGGFIAVTEPATQTQTGADAALYKTTKRDKFAPIVTYETRTARSQGDAK